VEADGSTVGVSSKRESNRRGELGFWWRGRGKWEFGEGIGEF